jgi:DNA-directed RNA polymerase subunit alpha
MLISQRPTLSEETVVDTRSRFVIEPLEPGFGYTLGNSLRRTLLSSIPGAAVTSIRIDGVLHEFTTVPGVKEDVTDIILNLKELVVSSEEDEPVTMYLRKQGPGTVTAGDIVPPAGVTVHNPDLHIATLNDKGRLEVELVVERGRGYVPAMQNKATGAEIGRIPVDSIYSPVMKVTYKVEATRVEQRTDFDKLVLDVETKPSITPRDALASAGKTLVELFGLARELNVDAEGIEIGSRCSPVCGRTRSGTPSPRSVPEVHRAAAGSGPGVSGRTGLAARTEDGRSFPALTCSPQLARSSFTRRECAG